MLLKYNIGFCESIIIYYQLVLMAQRLACPGLKIRRSPVQVPPKTNFSIMIKLLYAVGKQWSIS